MQMTEIHKTSSEEVSTRNIKAGKSREY